MEATNLTVHYKHDKAVISFNQQVDSASILNLCEEIDTAVDDYHYRKVQIRIESPGGEIDALQYYIDKLPQWRRKQVQLETMALMQSSSAAALMLSLGDLGKRSAAPSANLLYHNARVYGSREPLTSEGLGELERRLSRIDDKMLMRLLRHLYADLDDRYFDFIENYQCVLRDDSKEIDINALRLLSAPGFARSLDTYTDTDSNRQSNREILKLKIASKLPNLDKKAPELIKLKTVADLFRALDGQPLRRKDSLILAWLSHRFDSYYQHFRIDKPMTPAEARAENLIDIIEGV